MAKPALAVSTQNTSANQLTTPTTVFNQNVPPNRFITPTNDFILQVANMLYGGKRQDIFIINGNRYARHQLVRWLKSQAQSNSILKKFTSNPNLVCNLDNEQELLKVVIEAFTGIPLVEVSEQAQSLTPTKREELVAEYEHYLETKRLETISRNDRLHIIDAGNISLEQQLELIAKYQQEKIQPIKEQIQQVIYDTESEFNTEDLRNELTIEAASQAVAEQLALTIGQKTKPGKQLSQADIHECISQALVTNPNGSILNTRDVAYSLVTYCSNLNKATSQQQEQLAQLAVVLPTQATQKDIAQFYQKTLDVPEIKAYQLAKEHLETSKTAPVEQVILQTVRTVNADFLQTPLETLAKATAQVMPAYVNTAPTLDSVRGMMIEHGLNRQESLVAVQKFDSLVSKGMAVSLAYRQAVNEVAPDFETTFTQQFKNEKQAIRSINAAEEILRRYVEFRPLRIRVPGGETDIQGVTINDRTYTIDELQTRINLELETTQQGVVSRQDIILALHGETVLNRIANNDVVKLHGVHAALEDHPYAYSLQQARKQIGLIKDISQDTEFFGLFGKTRPFDSDITSPFHFLPFGDDTHFTAQTEAIVDTYQHTGFEADVVADNGVSWLGHGSGLLSTAWSQAKGYVGNKLAQWGVMKGLKGFIATGIGKLGAALGINVVPGLGQALSIAMLAKTALDTLEKIPILNKLPGVMAYSFLKRHGAKILAGAAGLAVAGIAYLLNSLLGSFSALAGNAVAFAAGTAIGGPGMGMVFVGINSALGNPIGAALSKLGGFSGISSAAGQGASVASSIISVSSAGIPWAVTAAPILAIGATALTTHFSMQMLMAAFALPPIDKASSEYRQFTDLTQLIPGMPECWPATGVVTQGMGVGSHRGDIYNSIDIGSIDALPGSPIYATHQGGVEFAGWESSGYGNLVIIRGKMEGEKTFQTYYGHLQTIRVKPGDIVTKGQVLGTMDNTGNSTGTHLHYELKGTDIAIVDTIRLAGCLTDPDAIKRIRNGCSDDCNVTITRTVQP